MTVEEIELVESVLIEKSVIDFNYYRRYINDFKVFTNWYFDDLCRNLQTFYSDMLAGKRPILLIQAPPQHGKSTSIIDFVSWLVGKNPENQIIYASFSERLGVRANLMLQRTFDSPKYQNLFQTRINSRNVVTQIGQFLRNRDVLEFVNTHGYFRNTTVSGSVTGENSSLLILDDPIKGREFANSYTIREKTYEWLVSDFMTRRSQGAGFLAIMTRWHIDDPFGRLMQLDKSIKVLTYKAIATEDETFRKEGEALLPDFKSIEFLLEQKKLLGNLNFESLYQQNPTIESGVFFTRDTFQYYQEDDYFIYFGKEKINKSELKIYQTIDPAGTENKTSDYFACVTFAVFNNNIIVLDIYKEKAETTRHELIIDTLYNKWKPIYQGVENKTFGINIIQNAKKKGRPIYPLKADKSKISRAEPLDVSLRNGLVWFNKNQTELEKELLQFPHGAHDDLVDCLAYAIILSQSKKNKIEEVWDEIYDER